LCGRTANAHAVALTEFLLALLHIGLPMIVLDRRRLFTRRVESQNLQALRPDCAASPNRRRRRV